MSSSATTHSLHRGAAASPRGDGVRPRAKALHELSCIVTPDTILRWYRERIAEKYDGSEQRQMGRPRTPDELRDLVTRMARENPGWGYTRLRDALGNLGYELARTTIRSIPKEHGIDPAPECLAKLVLLGENHLHTAVREYIAHYHTERNHQDLDGRLLEPPANDSGTGPMDCRERLGGLLRFYRRQET